MKRIVITGGAQGIGAATARALADRGHAVVIGDIDEALAGRTAAAIAQATGSRVTGLRLDVTDASAFADFLDHADLELGGIDVLVNNAGIMPTGSFLDEPDHVTDRQLDINVRGVLTGTKLAARRFVDQGGGHVVNIASLVGLGALPGIAVYSATKYAVVGLGAALHAELAPLGVPVTTICPAYVKTGLIDGIPQPWIVRKLAIVEPEQIAAAVVKAVETGRGGQRIVPHTAGALVYAMNQLPARVRNKITDKTGVGHAMLEADEDARAGYRARTEA